MLQKKQCKDSVGCTLFSPTATENITFGDKLLLTNSSLFLIKFPIKMWNNQYFIGKIPKKENNIKPDSDAEYFINPQQLFKSICTTIKTEEKH